MSRSSPAPEKPPLSPDQKDLVRRVLAEAEEERFHDEVRKRRDLAADANVGPWVSDAPVRRIKPFYSDISRGERVSFPEELVDLDAGTFIGIGWGDNLPDMPPWRRATLEEEASRPQTLQSFLRVFAASRGFASARELSKANSDDVAAKTSALEALTRELAELQEEGRLLKLDQDAALKKTSHTAEEIAAAERVVFFRLPPPPPAGPTYFEKIKQKQAKKAKLQQDFVARFPGIYGLSDEQRRIREVAEKAMLAECERIDREG